MNLELKDLIHDKSGYIKDVRIFEGRIQVKILDDDSEISWIEIFQAPSHVEKVIVKWLSLGGEI